MYKLQLKVELNGVCGYNKSCNQVSKVVIDNQKLELAGCVADFLFRFIQQGWLIPQTHILTIRDKVNLLSSTNKVTQNYKQIFNESYEWGSFVVSINLV